VRTPNVRRLELESLEDRCAPSGCAAFGQDVAGSARAADPNLGSPRYLPDGDRARRKPRVRSRSDGLSQLRLAARQLEPSLSQLPPRIMWQGPP
jgi:hypothetical protein